MVSVRGRQQRRVRRCLCYSDDQEYRWSYERRWAASLGLESVVVVNLFAYRSTDPKALQKTGVDIMGDLNDEAIRSAGERSAVTLAAWGGGGKLNDRGRAIAARYDTLMCLGITSDGEPRHPLYVPQATEPVLYRRPPV